MFTKDSRQENFLTQKGGQWKYSNNVTHDDLEPNWDYVNLGRSQVQVEQAIAEYCQRMDAGSAAPAPILNKTPRGLEVIDGVQRLVAAHRRNTTRFSAYIVETDSELLVRRLRVFANHLLQGHPEPTEWTRQQAIQVLIIEGKMSVAEVAEEGGWKVKDIEEDKTYLDWSFAIRCIGGPQKLTKGVVLNIADHARMDDLQVAPEPIAEFCNCLKRGRFSNDDSQPHIVEFFDVNRKNRRRIYAQFVQRLEEFNDDPEVQTRLTGRKRSGQSSEIKLRSQLKSSRTVTEELVSAGAQINFMAEFFQIWNQVEKNLKTIEKQSKTIKV